MGNSMYIIEHTFNDTRVGRKVTFYTPRMYKYGDMHNKLKELTGSEITKVSGFRNEYEHGEHKTVTYEFTRTYDKTAEEVIAELNSGETRPGDYFPVESICDWEHVQYDKPFAPEQIIKYLRILVSDGENVISWFTPYYEDDIEEALYKEINQYFLDIQEERAQSFLERVKKQGVKRSIKGLKEPARVVTLKCSAIEMIENRYMDKEKLEGYLVDKNDTEKADEYLTAFANLGNVDKFGEICRATYYTDTFLFASVTEPEASAGDKFTTDYRIIEVIGDWVNN